MYTARRAFATLLLLVPLACGDDKSPTTLGMTGNPPVTDSDPTNASEGASEASSTGGTTGEPTTSGVAPTTTMTPGETGETTSTGGPTTAETTAETTAQTTAQTETGGSSSTGAAAGCDGDAPRVRLVTNKGDMVVQLDAVNAPITVANFIDYVEADFYVDTIFHRVISGFVLQGGGYTSDLMMKPTNPPIALEISPELKHVDGAIAMARTNDPNSATSQFYICDGPQDFLDGNYAVFGVLIEGFDVRDAIAATPTDANDQPLSNVIILDASCE